MRVLGSRGSGCRGPELMTPGWEDALAEHRGDSRRARALVMAAAAVLVTVAAMAWRGAPEAPAAVKDVMVTIIIPSSEVIFTAAAEPPEDDQRWVAARESAVMLTEAPLRS